jgi:hypothetical protein
MVPRNLTLLSGFADSSSAINKAVMDGESWVASRITYRISALALIAPYSERKPVKTNQMYPRVETPSVCANTCQKTQMRQFENAEQTPLVKAVYIVK